MPRETETRQERTPPTGDPHRREDPAEDPPAEGRATQGTHTGDPHRTHIDNTHKHTTRKTPHNKNNNTNEGYGLRVDPEPFILKGALCA